eukprot:m.213963 g.213963  ORF g.213963 m.213963 type:complete len:92 (-) comp15581_c0_seq1:2971-3246(-)
MVTSSNTSNSPMPSSAMPATSCLTTSLPPRMTSSLALSATCLSPASEYVECDPVHCVIVIGCSRLSSSLCLNVAKEEKFSKENVLFIDDEK